MNSTPMSKILTFPAKYSPAAEIAQWSADFVATIVEARLSIDGARRRRDIISAVKLVQNRWTASYAVVREFLEYCASVSAARLIDRLDDIDEVLADLVIGPGNMGLLDVRRTAEERLQMAMQILDIAACRAFGLVKQIPPGKSFLEVFESYRKMLVDLPVPKMTAWQRRRFFKELRFIDDLHGVISHEV